ncbi:TlpA disulfide reductase family protein [Aliiglaciecola sp. LCG003]|uniref:TlpA family protein disulfide reductase n=1 Tax=Aliiglaciecola sp. LCG003 TaxID=3053655 RepID=UPI002572739D|nr:TlpA disulfide reductase family protein [Aliiglaciecola sp. LCG003]WJG11144.1 TlpA disulfide reductase family protein [Aliiglaciecola sp. LCG003]
MKKFGFILVCVMAGGLGLYLSPSLQYDFKTLNGKQFRWHELKQQYIIVNYFAEWCAPCLKEIPQLNIFSQYAQQQADVVLFAVNFDNLDESKLKQLKQKYSMKFDIISGLPNNPPFNRPRALPATFIISPQGELIKELNGEMTNEELQNIIEKLRTL